MKNETIRGYYKLRKQSGKECGIKAKLDEISGMRLYTQHSHDPQVTLYLCHICGFIHMGKKKLKSIGAL